MWLFTALVLANGVRMLSVPDGLPIHRMAAGVAIQVRYEGDRSPALAEQLDCLRRRAYCMGSRARLFNFKLMQYRLDDVFGNAVL